MRNITVRRWHNILAEKPDIPARFSRRLLRRDRCRRRD